MGAPKHFSGARGPMDGGRFMDEARRAQDIEGRKNIAVRWHRREAVAEK